ncbi:MAG: LppC family lipoprotein, partial [Massilia sp.]|nr:LppC family lipoprotein [Massilia sp.]
SELPVNMLIIGLTIEDEARQEAEWAAEEKPSGVAIIITGASAWQRRIANSFAARWKQLGHSSQQLVLADTNGYLSEAALAQLRGQIDAAAPVLIFGALDPSQAAQVRAAAGSDLPFYATSSVNPGADPATMIADLVGVRMLDLPWEVQPGHAAAMVYPRWNGATAAGAALDMDRLYALGIDSFRIAREISLRQGQPFTLDGVTGNLTVDFGKGPARFNRVQRAAIYQGGGFSLIGPATR